MSKIDKRSLTVTVNGTDFTASLSAATIKSADANADFVSFADAAAGGARAYTFEAEAVQDAVSGSFWDLCFSQAGQQVPVIYRPYGNATPTASKPHFTFTVIISEPNGDFLGGQADSSTTAFQVVKVEWDLLAKPVKLTQ